MRTRPQNQQYLLGLGAAGAVAVLAVSLAYAVSQRRRRSVSAAAAAVLHAPDATAAHPWLMHVRQPYTKLEWETSLEEIGVIRNFDDIVDEIADRVRDAVCGLLWSCKAFSMCCKMSSHAICKCFVQCTLLSHLKFERIASPCLCASVICST